MNTLQAELRRLYFFDNSHSPSLSAEAPGLIAPERIGMIPCATHHAHLVPALQEGTGVWSAFVAPDLAAIFGHEPWLDVCPNAEAQAHVLARLECIKPTVFEKLLTRSAPIADPPLAANENSLTPKRFLHNVMNDPTIAMPLRIDAAKALLPYL